MLPKNRWIYYIPRNISRCGGIGRRGRLKIYFWQQSAGSSPVIGKLLGSQSYDGCLPFIVLTPI